MPRNRQHIPREQRVEELLVAADELFLTRGFAKTAMSDIAASTGVTNGALYWYFPTKDHILAAVMDRALNLEIERQGDRIGEVGDPSLLLWRPRRTPSIPPAAHDDARADVAFRGSA